MKTKKTITNIKPLKGFTDVTDHSKKSEMKRLLDNWLIGASHMLISLKHKTHTIAIREFKNAARGMLGSFEYFVTFNSDDARSDNTFTVYYKAR